MVWDGPFWNGATGDRLQPPGFGSKGAGEAASRDAVEGKEPKRRPQKRGDRRLEEVAKAVGGGYCRLQMPLRLARAVRETVAGHGLGALEDPSPPSNAPLAARKAP